MSTIASDFAYLARSLRRPTWRQPGRIQRARLLTTGQYVKTSSRGKR